MANDINKEDPHYKGEYGCIYEVNRKFPTGGVAGDFVVIDGWAHYWNAVRGTWCVNAERDSYWDELITNIIEKFKLVRGATFMGVASLDTVPTKVIGAKMYYFATVAGTYKNFDNLVVPQGINVLYSENGSSWVNTTLLEVAQELGVSTNKVVSQKAVSDKLSDLSKKTSSINQSSSKGKFQLRDSNGNIGFEVNNDGAKAKSFQISDEEGNVALKLDESTKDRIISVPLCAMSISKYNAACSKYYNRGYIKTTQNLLPLLVVGGQSNADGRVPLSEVIAAGILNSEGKLANGKKYMVWNWETNEFQEYQAGVFTGSFVVKTGNSMEARVAPDLIFANDYLNDGNDILYCLKTTMGDTGIYNDDALNIVGKWSPDKGSIKDSGILIDALVERFNNMISYCETNGVMVNPIAILWHQGEHDGDVSWASGGATASDGLGKSVKEYDINLEKVRCFFRGVFKNENIPWLGGEISSLNSAYKKINEKIRLVDEKDTNSHIVDMSSFVNDSDFTKVWENEQNIHFGLNPIKHMADELYNWYKENYV